MRIQMKWTCVKADFDTKTLQLADLPAYPEKHETDAEIAIDAGGYLSFAEIHLGDVKSSNAFAKELVRRWNEFPEELKL